MMANDKYDHGAHIRKVEELAKKEREERAKDKAWEEMRLEDEKNRIWHEKRVQEEKWDAERVAEERQRADEDRKRRDERKQRDE